MRQSERHSQRSERNADERQTQGLPLVAVHRLVVAARQMACFHPSGTDHRHLQAEEAEDRQQKQNRLRMSAVRLHLAAVNKESEGLMPSLFFCIGRLLGGLFIAIIDALTNLLIDDGYKGYNNYTLNLTSSSISGCVHLPPFGIFVISWRFPSTVTVFLGSVRLMRCCGSR